MKGKQKTKIDLADSADDKKHLEPEETILDLPDVSDIPGQEHIHVPPAGEMADTTISSDDEEGKGLFDEDETDDLDNDLSSTEINALRDAAGKSPSHRDEDNLRSAQLDQRDDDGELLNEKINFSGSDLDIPGSEDDNAAEKNGEEDEENNSYSLDSEDEDESISKD
ncbi:MAG: hypothetical protein WDN26_23330 [Chitinophagaceae bacterium]